MSESFFAEATVRIHPDLTGFIGKLRDELKTAIAQVEKVDPPKVVATAPYNEGDTVSMEIEVSSTVAAGGYFLKVDWDDGTQERIPVTARNMTLTHAYGDNRPTGQIGRYIASAQLVNGKYTRDYDVGTPVTHVFDIANVYPAPTFTFEDRGGGLIGFTGRVNDPGFLDTHTIVWSFGDGTYAMNTLSPSRTFTRAGIVTLTVTDDDGGTGSVSLTVPGPFAPMPAPAPMPSVPGQATASMGSKETPGAFAAGPELALPGFDTGLLPASEPMSAGEMATTIAVLLGPSPAMPGRDEPAIDVRIGPDEAAGLDYTLVHANRDWASRWVAGSSSGVDDWRIRL